MKLRVCMALAAGLAFGQANAGNYILTIDGQAHEIDLGEPTSMALPDGSKVSVTLARKSVVSFKTENLSFDYPSRLSPSRTDMGDGIYQTIMTTPLGTLVMIQEYTSLNPSHLVDLMLNELTKEEAQYGYDITKGPSVQPLSDGTKLKGKSAVSTYKGDKYTRRVLAYDGRDSGLLIVTQMEGSAPPEDLVMLETFWKSLKITMD